MKNTHLKRYQKQEKDEGHHGLLFLNHMRTLFLGSLMGQIAIIASWLGENFTILLLAVLFALIDILFILRYRDKSRIATFIRWTFPFSITILLVEALLILNVCCSMILICFADALEPIGTVLGILIFSGVITIPISMKICRNALRSYHLV